MTAGALLRALAGGAIGGRALLVVIAPETTAAADAAALLVAALTAWRPRLGLAALVALAPLGQLLTPAPARVAELLAWMFVAAWLLRVVAQRGATGQVPRNVLVPAVLFGVCAAASWIGLTLADAGGVEAAALPMFVLRSLMPGHLMSTATRLETLVLLQTGAGLSVFLAAAIVGQDAAARRYAAYAIVGSAAMTATLTFVDVARQWGAAGFGGWFLLRYFRGERFAVHVPDLNAAGSLYVLAILAAAALAMLDRHVRRSCAAAIVLMLPALWLTGSRSAALGGLIVGAALIAVVRSPRNTRMPRAVGAAIVAAVVALGGATLAASREPADPGSATQSLWMRSQFLVTSARMLASSPVLGVGVGRYHERSSEFMPPALRAIYPRENAHNYFAQQFAELGLVGGGLFVWLIVAGLASGWRHLRVADAEPALLALVAGGAGYLLTCVTGHPLLVSEAALPFWGLFGVTAAVGAQAAREASRPRSRTAIASLAAAVLVLVLAGVALQARAYRHPLAPTPERGFYGLQQDAHGRAFVWMTRHGVWSVGPQPGVIVIPLRAPRIPSRSKPFEVDVDVAGWRVGTYTIAADEWTTVTIPLRERSSRPFRRVDLWANQTWTRKHQLGDRDDDAPRSLMVGEVRWEGAGGR